MTDFLEDEDDEIEWGVVPPKEIPEPAGDRLTSLADSRHAAEKLWLAVQKELRRAD